MLIFVLLPAVKVRYFSIRLKHKKAESSCIHKLKTEFLRLLLIIKLS